MALELWLAFAAASTALLAIPGPTVMLVVSYALGQGRASGWATVPGVTLGDFTAMTISLAGAGAVLAASAELFTVLKLCGAAYLIWLGVKLWRAEPQPPGALNFRQRGQARAMFANAFAVTALNPKSIVFFVAFVPQFVDPASPALPQFVVLEATFLALAAANAALWAVLAGEMRERFRKPATLRVLNRTGAGFLIGAGVLTALARR
jgi:threonine/homoserine/homoserine lactone efflux protein